MLHHTQRDFRIESFMSKRYSIPRAAEDRNSDRKEKRVGPVGGVCVDTHSRGKVR